jgi:hypothetical protein
VENILFIAHHFPPMGGPGTNRSLRFVQELRSFGYEPVVLTITEEDLKAADYPMDNSLMNKLPPQLEIIRVPTSEPRRLRRLLVKLKLFRLAWIFLFPFFWERSARWFVKAIPVAEKLIREKQIRIVYTTSGPFSSAVIGYKLRKRSGIKWVADLRDPYTDAYAWQFPNKIFWKLCRRMEKKILGRADKLILNTPSTMELFSERGISKAHKMTVITNGF